MWEMGKKKEGEASSFVPATGVPLPPVRVGQTGFSQFPTNLMSRSFPHILYSLYHLLQRLQKNPNSFITEPVEPPNISEHP